MMSKSEAYVPLVSLSEPDSPNAEPNGCHWENQNQASTVGRRCFAVSRNKLLLVIIFIQTFGSIILFLSYRRKTFAYDELLATYTSVSKKPHLYLYSPANDILEDQIKVFDDGFIHKSNYQEYSDESDRAWEDLYNRTTMKIPKSEAALLPNRTWPIKEFPGYYIAQLDVFHQLHCLNKIRQALRRDRYDRLLEDPEADFHPEHLAHCIDSIRQYVMCHSDPSVVFWQWDPKSLVVRPRLEYPHMCKNFEKVRAWAEERHIDDYIDPKVYVEDDLPPPPIIY